MVNDGFGSSEAGVQGSSRVTGRRRPAGAARCGSRPRAPSPRLVARRRRPPVEPGSGVVGRIVTGGGSRSATTATPRRRRPRSSTYEGERWLITGDLATVADDGTVELLGRGSVSINTGGEKVHPEEVEGVLHGHPAVRRRAAWSWACPTSAGAAPSPPSCSRRRAPTPTLEELVAHCKQHLSGYKAPEAPRARRARRAQRRRQGRLPLGPRHRRKGGRRLSPARSP